MCTKDKEYRPAIVNNNNRYLCVCVFAVEKFLVLLMLCFRAEWTKFSAKRVFFLDRANFSRGTLAPEVD